MVLNAVCCCPRMVASRSLCLVKVRAVRNAADSRARNRRSYVLVSSAVHVLLPTGHQRLRVGWDYAARRGRLRLNIRPVPVTCCDAIITHGTAQERGLFTDSEPSDGIRSAAQAASVGAASRARS